LPTMKTVCLLLVFLGSLNAAEKPRTSERACSACIRAHEEFLAADALNGRGSGTRDELVAATYVASQLRQYGIEPAAEGSSYIQAVPFTPKQSSTAGNPPAESTTWNVLGILPGRDPKLKKQAILLSAHIDHLGEGREVNGDRIYNGADDDASGVTAVLELARSLARHRPRRTVIFAFFGAEELGGIGSRYFLAHSPVPLNDIAANLEFEMIGRADPAVDPRDLWLTGYERSNLGPELAKHGARLVADPHPREQFFQRSDNYMLAQRGVVAHTVSSFGLHKQYHQPDDDIAHLDFRHMQAAISSMLGPVRWLVNSDFRPQWNRGGEPEPKGE